MGGGIAMCFIGYGVVDIFWGAQWSVFLFTPYNYINKGFQVVLKDAKQEWLKNVSPIPIPPSHPGFQETLAARVA